MHRHIRLPFHNKAEPKPVPCYTVTNDSSCSSYSFEQSYEVCYTKAYGFFRPVISRVVRKYLECGDLHQGFARVRCPDCHHEYLLAFSCRGRWFCPSCHTKKVVQFAGHGVRS